MKRAPRFVFASDSLKGTLSSADAAHLLGAAAERHFPGCAWTAAPMADGGEGTVARCSRHAVARRSAPSWRTR